MPLQTLAGFSPSMWYLPDSSKPFAYRFLSPSDTAYWQLSDPDIVWQFTRDNKVRNVENYAFILESAVLFGSIFSITLGLALLI